MMRSIGLISMFAFCLSLHGCKRAPDDPAADLDSEQPPAFAPEEDYRKNRIAQSTMTPETVGQLRDHGITEDTELRLEHFFHTNSEAKAKSLTTELTNLGYESRYSEAEGRPELIVIKGRTSPMKMQVGLVEKWVGEMCDLGERFDCLFDGWGAELDP